MKRFLTTILCVIYVVASSGATINFHYCMGKFIGFDFAAASNKNCNNCGMAKEQKKGCCNDKHATIQLKKDQLSVTVNTIPQNQLVIVNKEFFSFSSLTLYGCNNLNKLAQKPPLLPSSPTFLRNCVFLI